MVVTKVGVRKILKDIYKNKITVEEFEEKYDTETLEELNKEELIYLSDKKIKLSDKGKVKYQIGMTEKADLPFFTDEESPKFVPLWMAKTIMNDYHFVTHEDSEELYVYDGGIYKPKGEMIVKREAQRRLGKYVKTHYVNESLGAVKRENYVPSEKFNNPDDGIVVENGLLDIKTRKLKEHSPEIVHLSKIPWRYDPERDCPKVKQFVSEIVHKSDVKLIQEMFGYCLLKDYPYAKTFMLLGGGANGKSTLIKLLEEFLGRDNISNVSLQEILDKRFTRIDLFGKLANTHADLPSKKLEDTGIFKMLTGDDTVRGEKKYQDSFQFRNYAKLIYSANELPKTSDRTDAFYRRWIVIDFPHQFMDDDKKTDPSLPHSIIDEEEMSGVLNWALDGLDRILKQNGFSHTKTRKDIKQKWMKETDSLRAFVQIACECKRGTYVLKNDFYEIYKAFCDENDIYTVKKGEVTKTLPTIKPQVQLVRVGKNNEIGGIGNRPRIWKNIQIKESFISDNESFIKGRPHVQEVLGTLTTSIARESNNYNIYRKSSQNILDFLDLKKQILDLLPESNEKPVREDLVIDRISLEFDISEEKAEKWIKKLKESGEIHEPRSGFIKKL